VVGAAAVERSESDHQFLELEWLGEVVVGAEFEPGELVVEAVGGCEHQDRHAAVRRDDAFGDLVTGGPGDVPVQHGDVVGVGTQQLQRAVAVTGNVGRDGFQAEAVADRFGHEGFVLDDQHAHACDAARPDISSAYRKTHTLWQRAAAFTAGVAYSQPARTAARFSRPTAYRVRWRRLVLGVVLGLLLAYSAGQLLNDAGHVRMPTARTRIEHRRASMSAVSWPVQGQAALVLGNGRPAASPDQQPVPIASVAKVMTAYLVLKRYPLSGAHDGFAITITAAQAQDAARDAAENQSRVPVAAGEELTERQLLEALLIPSGNNIAWILAAQVAGSDTGFVAEMNAEARTLGLDHTTYTDPSGFDPGTVSTAADQLRVLRQAMRFPVFREIVSMPSVTLPVAGTVTNFDPLVSAGYGGKTGSDSAAGGCLAFFTNVTIGGHPVTAAGVVLGQGQGSNTQAILAAAGEAAQRLVDSVAPAAGQPTIASPGLLLLPGRTVAATAFGSSGLGLMSTHTRPTGAT
jgi:serine-type D-Ala-D-Ala carboxypeptidase (penicillin-binding protein 5/6)